MKTKVKVSREINWQETGKWGGGTGDDGDDRNGDADDNGGNHEDDAKDAMTIVVIVMQ